ncbi:jg16075 [Pararge aegeria aegeria]|uniref:Jg16075 protein n=1 Tax=Pararge aegeria aegeria TaxID=348720 RepID=A0A8S4SIY2_9NEOP|nr:jg16075 [Pararge aegeria aegeria]
MPINIWPDPGFKPGPPDHANHYTIEAYWHSKIRCETMNSRSVVERSGRTGTSPNSQSTTASKIIESKTKSNNWPKIKL